MQLISIMFRRTLSLLPRVKFVPRFYFSAPEAKEITPQQAPKPQEQKNITYYKDGELVSKNQLTLKKYEDIEGYVFKLIKSYFRCTNRNNLHLESLLEDHGLDSLDSIELAMQIEEDLGYVISAETLPVLRKVKHFVNYIRHVENFKQEMKRAPLS